MAFNTHLLDCQHASADDPCEALDWLADRQHAIERRLAKRHLAEGGLALFDVSSSFLEGSCNELAAFGHSRDHRRDRPQLACGLLCDQQGCPVAIRAFPGNTADPATLGPQVRQRFGLQRIALVGDHGRITQARIREDLQPHGLDWVTALRHSTIRRLAGQRLVQPSLLDTRDMASASSPDFPGERLLVCCNPLVAAERRRKRNALLERTEQDARKLGARYQAGKIDRDEPSRRLGTRRRRKMGKHFRWEFDPQTEAFVCERRQDSIAAEQSLDGIHVVRTSLGPERLDDAGVVRACKSLAQVERAFRSLQTTLLRVRPVCHWKERRVRAHLVPVHAGALPGVAPAAAAGAAAVRRRAGRRAGGQPGGQGAAEPGGAAQGLSAQDAEGRPAAAELPGPAGQPGGAGGGGAGVRGCARPRGADAEQDDAAAEEGVPAAGPAAPSSPAAVAAGGRLVTTAKFSDPRNHPGRGLARSRRYGHNP